MFRRFRFTRVMSTEPIVELLTGSHITSTGLSTLQNINMKHPECRQSLRRKEIGVTGFEPATSWSQTRRSTKLSYTPKFLDAYHARHDLACRNFATCRRGDRSTKLSYTPRTASLSMLT